MSDETITSVVPSVDTSIGYGDAIWAGIGLGILVGLVWLIGSGPSSDHVAYEAAKKADMDAAWLSWNTFRRDNPGIAGAIADAFHLYTNGATARELDPTH